LVAGILDIEEFVRSKLPSLFINHVKTVVKESEWLCLFHPEADREIVTVSAWLHDIGQTLSGIEQYRLTGGRSATSAGEEEPHHVRGLGIAREYLVAAKFPREKIGQVLHCIESHRTSKPPAPTTIEAKIVASADKLSHFLDFETIANIIGYETALRKLERDLAYRFMLPEAREEAQKLFSRIQLGTGGKAVKRKS